MEFSVYYIDDTKLDHYYTQVSRLSDKKTYPLPDNQPLQELLQGLINFTRAPHKVSDACLELKTPDYHRYLDMEYTLKEHTQDFGVSITKKDSLVIKTKLSLLVAALKDKMDQCSYGGDTRTLRTILKHIPGIIDEDSDFAPELLKQNGLAFLRSLPERDNYSNFDRKKVTTIVLNVLFKIVSYVDGLMSVFRDRNTVSWLYSQVKGCSDGRNPEGRNITIAILYIFVDSDLDTDAGPSIGPHDLAVLSIKCAQEVHQRDKTPPFSVFLDLLSDKIQSDPETVLAVIRLINKMLETLKEADEMDLFDDLVLALLDQGLSKIIEKHKQGKTAKNKIVLEYNTFSKILCQEYEDTGDLDSILKSCIHRRPSYQPGSYHSGSEGNLSLLDRDRRKRSSLTHNSLTPKLADKSELELPRSMTPDLKLVIPTKTSKSSDNLSEPEKTPFTSQGTKEWKRKTALSNGIGMTSTPKPESANESRSFKQSDYLSAKDSYTPGTYRATYSPAGDSGYQSGTSLSRSESNEKIISPYDRTRKEFYEAKSRTPVANLVFNEPDKETESKSPSRSGLKRSPYSLKNSERSEFSYNSSHAPLTVTKSHPYRDSLPSPAGPPRKLDSPFSSYSRPVTSKSLVEKQTEPTPAKQEVTQPRIIGKLISQSDMRVIDSTTKVGSLESRWRKRESPPASENKPTNSEFKPRETKSLHDRRGRLDASQIMSAVQGSQPQSNKADNSVEEVAVSKETGTSSSPYSLYSSYKNNQTKNKQRSVVKDFPPKQEVVPEKKEETAKPLKQRFKELALSSEKAVSVDELDATPTPVKMPTLTHKSFDKESPTPEISKLPKQVSVSVVKPADPPIRPSPLLPSQSQRLQFAEFGCDLAPFSEASVVTIAPFSPDLRWTPGDFVTQQTRAPQPNILERAEARVPSVPVSLPIEDKPSAPSPVSSPTEENPFAKHIAERRKSSVSTKEARVLIPLPEVNLAKHELSFGPIKFQELGNKYDKDPYEGEVKKVSHVAGSIPSPPPDMPRPSRIPDPPPDVPEVRTGPDPGKKGKRKMNFRWNLVGKGGASEKRSFWKFDKKVEVPLEIINSFTANPDSTPDRVLTKSTKSTEKKIEVLVMARRTSLGVSLKCLEKFELRDVENNFRALRKILTALDLEVMNEEIIEVLEKGVLTSKFDSELAQIRRAKQEALSIAQSVTLLEEEKFLLSLGEVESLKERISIATFCLRFHEKEEEIAKKLMILMGAATEVRSSPTFKDVLNTLLSIGNAVEHKQAGGFDLEFLQRAESYKDSCHKKDLINHAAFCVIEKNPVSTNLYSDFPNVHDAWRMEIDFVELRLQIQNEQEIWSKCKMNVEKLQLANYDNLSKRLEQLGHKINKFYITLGRMENYYRDLYLYFGYDKYLADSQKLLDFLRILHNFSLAYKTNHERILQIKEKMAQEKRREKTRGKKLPIAENIQVKMVDRVDGEGAKSESGAEDDGTGYSRGVMNAVLEHRKEKKPKTGAKYRNKQNGNRREKRNSIRRTLNEEDGLIDIAKKELAESPTS